MKKIKGHITNSEFNDALYERLSKSDVELTVGDLEIIQSNALNLLQKFVREGYRVDFIEFGTFTPQLDGLTERVEFDPHRFFVISTQPQNCPPPISKAFCGFKRKKAKHLTIKCLAFFSSVSDAFLLHSFD